MVIKTIGGLKIPSGSGVLSLSLNTPPVWQTPEGSLGSRTEDETIDSGNFQVVATDVNELDVLDYSIFDGSLPNSVASGGILFGGQPNPADSIIINGNIWTFVTTGASGLQSNIGATLALTLDALVNGLNADATASITLATYLNDGTSLIIHHNTPGTGGNSFTISDNVANGGTQTPTGTNLEDGGGGNVIIDSLTGAITGDEIVVGETITFVFTVEVNDGKLLAYRTFSIKIDDTSDPVWVTTTDAFANFPADEGDLVGEAYTVEAVDADGSPDPIEYEVIAGVFPAGFDWSDSDFPGPSLTGLITGVATDGSFDRDEAEQFTVCATDGLNTSDRAIIIPVNCTTFDDGTGSSATGRDEQDTTGLVSDINLIYGVGTGTTGYGQTPVTITSSVGDEVLKSELLDWRTAINLCESHQGITLDPASPATTLLDDPKPWSAETYFDGLVNNTDNGTVDISDDPTLVDAINSTALTGDPDSVNQSRGTSWTVSVQHEFTVTFLNADEARAFFNAGGEIRIDSSRSGGLSTAQNTAWTNLLVAAGTVTFNASNYFALTESLVSFFNEASTGTYEDNDWDIAAKTNADDSVRGGKGNVLTFRSLYTDGHVGIDGGPDEVDGTLLSEITMRNVDGTFLTIDAPDFLTTIALTVGGS